MQKLYYDLHIHSCLSPCGDNDMTVNNIAGMGKLAGLDIMALTRFPESIVTGTAKYIAHTFSDPFIALGVA